MVGLPGLYLLLRDEGESIAPRAAKAFKHLPQWLALPGALHLQPCVQHAGAGIQPLQVGAQAGTVTLGRAKLKLGARKLRQAFAELLIKRSASSSALRTWARIHWRLGSV